MIKIPDELYKITTDYFIKYHWDISFIIMSTGKEIRPKYLNNVVKTCNFITSLFPTYTIECQIEDIYHKLINDNRNDIICQIKLTKKLWKTFEVTSNSGYSGKPSIEEVVMEETFLPFFKDLNGDYVPPENVAKIDADEEQKSNNNISDGTFHKVRVELNHFGSEEINKSTYNILAVDATPGDVLTYLLSSENAGIKSAIIDPLDNNTVYPYIIIPPRNFKNSLKWLNVQWGLYTDNPIFFIDLGFMYVLKQGLLEHEIMEGDANSTYIEIFQKPDALRLPNVATVTEEKNNFSYSISQPLDRTETQLQLAEITPDEVIFSNFDLATNALDVVNEMGKKTFKFKPPKLNMHKPVQNHNQSKKKIVFEYDSTNNPYNVAARMRQYGRKNIIQLLVGGVDLESFNPNKKITLKVADDAELDKKYSGDYNLISVGFRFSAGKGIENSFLTTCDAYIGISEPIN